MEYPERASTQRVSSFDRDWEDGNIDGKKFEPGQTRVLADLEGPGRITHIWCSAFGYERGLPRSVVLRIFWDGSEQAAVESLMLGAKAVASLFVDPRLAANYGIASGIMLTAAGLAGFSGMQLKAANPVSPSSSISSASLPLPACSV